MKNELPLGKWVNAPAQEMRDDTTGIAYSVLTGGVGNNTHIYFNRENFTADSKQLIFRSDRTGSWQVYAYDIAGERMRRLTDAALDPARPSIDPCNPLLYYTQGNTVLQLNIDTLEENKVYEHPTPEGGTFLLMDISGDGQF